MNGFISSPFKMIAMTTKPNFVVDPIYLLEAKETFYLNIQEYIDRIEQVAVEIFIAPISGVYRKNSFNPLFTAYDALYTHKQTHEFFPEVSSPVFLSKRKLTLQERAINSLNNKETNLKTSDIAQRTGETLGKRIDWREAIESQINVYSKEGNLLLRSKDNRKNLLFNPGPSILSKRFVIDLIEYCIKNAAHWGDTSDVEKRVSTYVEPEYAERTMDIIELGLKMCNELRVGIHETVSKNPWLIYSVSNVGPSVMIDSSCDYRHFKCNEILWEQQNTKDRDLDVLETYIDVDAKRTVDFEDIEQFLEFITVGTGYRIENLEDLGTLIGESKNDRKLTERLVTSLTSFMQVNDGHKTRSTKLVNDLMGFNSGNQHFNFNEATGIFFL